MSGRSDRRTGDLLLHEVYVVVCRKTSGKWQRFGQYRDPREAAGVAARLRQVGAEAEARIVNAEDVR